MVPSFVTRPARLTKRADLKRAVAVVPVIYKINANALSVEKVSCNSRLRTERRNLFGRILFWRVYNYVMGKMVWTMYQFVATQRRMIHVGQYLKAINLHLPLLFCKHPTATSSIIADVLRR